MVGAAAVVLLGGLPDHRLHLGEVMHMGKGHQPRPGQEDQHPRDHRLFPGRGRQDLQQPAAGHHEQHRHRRAGDDLPVDADVGAVHKAPRAAEGQGGEGKELAEGAHKAAVGDGQHHKGHQRHAADKPPGDLGQAEHQPRKDQAPAQGEQGRRQILDAHHAHAAIGKTQGEVQHQIGQQQRQREQIGPHPSPLPAVQPVPGKALPEGQTLVLPRLLFVQGSFVLFHRNLHCFSFFPQAGSPPATGRGREPASPTPAPTPENRSC